MYDTARRTALFKRGDRQARPAGTGGNDKIKKRIFSILLICCMMFGLLPMTAFAADRVDVGTEAELLGALANEECDRINLTKDISVSSTLTIDRGITFYLNSRHLTMTGSGGLFHVTDSGSLQVVSEGITGEVLNEGVILGDFDGKVINFGTISKGNYNGEVVNQGGEITDGEFRGEVINSGVISGGIFTAKVTNSEGCKITSGEFYGEVINQGEIIDANFYDAVTGSGEIPDNLYVTVTFVDSDGGNPVDSQRLLRGQKAQRPATPTKDGYTFIGWYNNGKHYPGPSEWAFSTPVTSDLTLAAKWMETLPVSTAPVTYLDADGKEQVCTRYTVLESNTADSILDLENKWYDLPAGWYVVDGNVTITPRVDTHGEVNLILKDGCHFTAEWGINVKEGDTFTVYAQSDGEDTMGKLTACLPGDFNRDGSIRYYVWPDSGMAGIGASKRYRGANDGFAENEGTIIINGGNIRAKGQWGSSAIGGPRADCIVSIIGYEIYNYRKGGSIIINGGIIHTENITQGNYTATESVGIGTCQNGYGGSVIINGGTINANASNDAICTGRGGSITINGGNVTAHGGINEYEEGARGMLRGNGIGSFWGGTVTINGGNIKAYADGEGSGIGSYRVKTPVFINGGTIEAVAFSRSAAIGGKGSVTINGGVINATGKGSAAGIGGDGDICIKGGEITVSAEGVGAAIGGNGGEDCGDITIQGDAIRSISSNAGTCIGGSVSKSTGNITITDAVLPPLSGNNILIGWNGNSEGSRLTIRNCRIVSTDTLAGSTDGICVGSNSDLLIENSEVRLPEDRGIRACDGGSIAVRDSEIHTYGIYMVRESMYDKENLKRLEITDSTVVTGDFIGASGTYASVEEIVIHGSSIRLNDEKSDNYCTIGSVNTALFGSIDIQDSQIDIPFSGLNTAIGNGWITSFSRESRIRIANSQVCVAGTKSSPAIGAAYASRGGRITILIENSTVSAEGGRLVRTDTEYIPGIGRNMSNGSTEIEIQILDSTVESFRHTKKDSDGSDLVYDDLHTKSLPNIPAENITICGSTVNGTLVEHSCDEYGKCALCGKYDLAYCYENGLLTIEGLTNCTYDGLEKKLTDLSHKTGENEARQLAEGTDYTVTYSHNVYPYTLTPDDNGFDPAEAPKVTLYGTGNYCGKAEHYFTIGGDTQPSYTVRFDTAGGTAIDDKTNLKWNQRVLDGVEPPTKDGYAFRGWSYNGKSVLARTTYAELAGNESVKSITLTALWAEAWYPEGEIRIDENTAWQSFQKVYFGQFYREGKTVTITATDASGDPVEISYLITDEILTKDQCARRSFQPYTEPIRLEPEGRYTVYVKLTNTVGNVTYLSADSIVLDTTPPVIEGVEDGGVYVDSYGIYVTVSDENLDSYVLDGVSNKVYLQASVRFPILAADNATHTIIAVDKAGNRAEKTVTLYKSYGVVPVTGVSLDENEVTLDMGSSQPLTATVTPENATNKKVRWSSDNESVATVSEDGVVTAVTEGTAAITVTTYDGLFTAKCTVTVSAPAVAPSITTDSLPDGKVGETYSQTLTADGTAPITWSIDGGTLPAGLSLSADTGEISGTPTLEETATFTVQAANSAGSDRKEMSITIAKAPAAEHTVTVKTDGGGTASASHTTAVADTEITLTATPDSGYHFKEWQVVTPTGLVITNDKFTMPDGNVEVKAIFEEDAPPAPTEHTVTVTSSGNGTASASPATATANTEITLTATPDSGYHFKEWQVVTPTGLVITNDKFTMPDSNVEIKALFEEDAPPAPTEHTVTVTSSGNGTASASPATATANTEITLIATPDSGYHFKEWQVVTPTGLVITNDKFTMPDGNVEVKAIFEEDAPPAPTEHTVTVTSSGNGTASASPATATANTEITLTATPDSGYHFKEWQVVTPTGLVITNDKFTMPDGNVEIKAIFEEDAPPAPTENTVTVSGGDSGTASAPPAPAENTVAATDSDSDYSYYTIKATSASGGSLSSSGNVSVREGSDQTFTITPDKGYAVSNVKIDGESIGAVKSYTFEKVSRPHTIEVVFMKANGNPKTGVFVDVATGSYYEDTVGWAADRLFALILRWFYFVAGNKFHLYF